MQMQRYIAIRSLVRMCEVPLHAEVSCQEFLFHPSLWGGDHAQGNRRLPKETLALKTSENCCAMKETEDWQHGEWLYPCRPPSIHTYAYLLTECARKKSLAEGRIIHGLIVANGAGAHTFLGNTLANMYAKCGSLRCTRQVFDRMPERNVFSWTIMILAYATEGREEEALAMFGQMESEEEGVRPNEVTLIIALKACARLAALEQGKQVHATVQNGGFNYNVYVASALVHMYAKCGSLEDAHKVFNRIMRRDVVLWTAMITGYAQHSCGKEALVLFEQMQCEGVKPNVVTYTAVLKACTGLADMEWARQWVHAGIGNDGFETDVVVGNGLIDTYAKCGSVEDARRVFDGMCERDLVSWNTMIAGYALHGRNREALVLFEQMQAEGVNPNEVTFTSVLKACAGLAALEEGKQIHASARENRFDSSILVRNALVDMYVKCGSIEDARQVFDETWQRSVVSWNAMIGGYAQHGHGKDAFKLFARMQQEGVKPDEVTFTVVLKACGDLAALEQGKQVHASIKKSGFEPIVSLQNALIDMYARCGSLDNARQVFNGMHQRSTVSWNAMIAGYAQHGCGKEALSLFEKMLQEGLKPGEITFISVLSACSQEGLVEEAFRFFGYMKLDQSITLMVEHYGCMVDLLCRLGCLVEAEDLINKMPIQPTAAIWKALLGACSLHGNTEVGKRAFECVLRLDSEDVAAYVVLSNMYAVVGRQDEVAKLEKELHHVGGSMLLE